MSSCETAIWQFNIGVYISCTVFVSFCSGHSEIAASLAKRVQPRYSLPRSHNTFSARCDALVVIVIVIMYAYVNRGMKMLLDCFIINHEWERID